MGFEDWRALIVGLWLRLGYDAGTACTGTAWGGENSVFLRRRVFVDKRRSPTCQRGVAALTANYDTGMCVKRPIALSFTTPVLAGDLQYCNKHHYAGVSYICGR
ncbi:hypothetical protein BPOR_1043g00040 [Botrytis porri]|uniref:Secreted protein n=1 Tax=Botrytis porri TaxID=87229 RepID=A0A4Z1KJU1_9HELO|nr:hypothetical protein BPOR_1043g00040 [Botrytis porri]